MSIEYRYPHFRAALLAEDSAFSARVADALRPLPSVLRGALGMTLPTVAGAVAVIGWRRRRGHAPA